MAETTKRAGLPEFWVTKLSALLVGEQSCRFASWIQGHYKIQKRERDGDIVSWKAKHTEMLNARVRQLQAEGWRCRVESQNFFKLKGNAAIVSGKPDIVASKVHLDPKGVKRQLYLVSDLKSGAKLDKNTAQVTIYQNILPLAWGRYDMELEGEVVYPDSIVPVTYTTALKMKEPLFRLIKELACATKPDATPSEKECLYCDVRKEDCPDRFGEGAAPFDIETSEF